MRIILLVLFTHFCFYSFSQELFITDDPKSPLNRLVNRVQDLRIITKEQRAEIDILEIGLKDLIRQKNNYQSINKSLSRDISEKSAKILQLRGELISTKYKYDQILYELDLLTKENQEYRQVVDAMINDKKELEDELIEVNEQVDNLQVALADANLYNEAKEAEVEALKKRINDLLEVRNNIYFLRVSGLSNYGYQVSISNGFLKYSNFYLGASASYSRLENVRGESFLETEIDTIDVSYLSFNGEVRISLLRDKNFVFEYLDSDEYARDNVKLYMISDFGVSIPILPSETMNKYKPSINGYLGAGVVIPSNNKSNFFGELGVRFKDFSIKTHSGTRLNDFESIFQIGLGIHF